MRIYKLLLPGEYAELQREGHSVGAPVDRADGFVHFSTAAQLEETARRHFAAVSRMWVLAVEAEALGDALVWEPSRGGALFPHLYGPLRADTVVAEVEVAREDGAIWSLGYTLSQL